MRPDRRQEAPAFAFVGSERDSRERKRDDMAFELPPLPYAQDAREPHYSAKTLSFNHGKHHQAYVTKLNELIEGTDNAKKSLEEIIKSSSGGLFNQAAQVWNHTFFWNCMKP